MTKVCPIAGSFSPICGAISGPRYVRQRPFISGGMVSRAAARAGNRMAGPFCIGMPTSLAFASSSFYDCAMVGRGPVSVAGTDDCLSAILSPGPISAPSAICVFVCPMAGRITAKISSPCSRVCMAGRSLSPAPSRRSHGMTDSAINASFGRSPSCLLSTTRHETRMSHRSMLVRYYITMLGNQ